LATAIIIVKDSFYPQLLMNPDTPENTTQIINPTEGTDKEIDERSDRSNLEPENLELDEAIDPIDTPPTTEPKPSYVKLAMRNMVKKRGISLQHFFLTTIALLAVLVGLAYLTR